MSQPHKPDLMTEEGRELEHLRQRVVALDKENERLRNLLYSHGPEGHSFTNMRVYELRKEVERLWEFRRVVLYLRSDLREVAERQEGMFRHFYNRINQAIEESQDPETRRALEEE